MPEWLATRLPEGWTAWHLAALTIGLAVLSALVSMPIIGYVLTRLPADYFVNAASRQKQKRRHPVLHVLAVMARNLFGVLLILLGLALSLPGVPGQGVLTILMGVMLVDFPGKFRVERWLITRRGIFSTVNRLRARYGQPPLLAHPDSQLLSPSDA